MVTASGIIQGASYTDVHARMPAALALAAAAAIGVVLSLLLRDWIARRGRSSPPPALYAVVLLGGGLYAHVHAAVRRRRPTNRRARRRISRTTSPPRARAFALDRIEERELTGDAELTRADVERNRETLENVRLWDHQPLLETFGQIQEIRTYYDFISVDNDRYELDGRTRQVMLSVRELNPAALPNRTWINERLVFTHGHGLTLGPVNQVDRKACRCCSSATCHRCRPSISQVTQPSIYFGELSNEYVIARTRAREFHYPKGEDNVYADYDGRGGIPASSLLRRSCCSPYTSARIRSC